MLVLLMREIGSAIQRLMGGGGSTHTDTETHRQTDRQTDRHTHTHTHRRQGYIISLLLFSQNKERSLKRP
jgi:hypothetical protein